MKFNILPFLWILLTAVNSITPSNQTSTTTSTIQIQQAKAYCGFQEVDDPWSFPLQFCSLTAFTQEACENTAYYGPSGKISSCVWWKPEKLQQIKYSAFCGHPKDGKPWDYPVMYCNEANIAMLSPKNKEECEATEVKPTLVEHTCIWNDNKGCTAENPENNGNCEVYIGESNCIKGSFFAVHNKCVWHVPPPSTVTQAQSITTITGPSASVSPSMSSLPSFSSNPTESPSPSQSPSKKPSSMPSIVPSKIPSRTNTQKPTRSTDSPTFKPSLKPSPFPTFVIIRAPIPQVTLQPTHLTPSYLPTRSPTYSPTKSPTNSPTLYPTRSTPKPSTKHPTPTPSRFPTITRSTFPSKWKSVTPTSTPSMEVSMSPSRYTTKPTLFRQLPVVLPTKAPTPVNIPATAYSMAPSKWRRPLPDLGKEKPSGSITGAIIIGAGLASVAVACIGCACCCCIRRRRQVSVAFADADANNVARKMFLNEV